MRDVLGAWILAIASMSALAGCGSSGGSTPGGLAAFVGLWNAQSGSLVLTCNGQTASTTPIKGNLTWTAGTSSDLLGELATTVCQVNANISGSTATASGTEACRVGSGSILNTYTYESYKFTLGSGGTTATESASGPATEVIYGGNPPAGPCTFSESATYQKE
jgi:hypothetical protein